MNSRKASEMESLLKDIRACSGISQSEAEQALGAMIGFLAARLPSPVMGRIREALSQNLDVKESGNVHK
jgi:hypothetical protein